MKPVLKFEIVGEYGWCPFQHFGLFWSWCLTSLMFFILFASVHCVLSEMCSALTGSCGWPSCLHLCLPRCTFAGDFQYCIILTTAFWTTCSAFCRIGLSGNIFALWRWPNGFFRPVLKHGPRSLGHVQVSEWQTPMRNESNWLDFCTIDRLWSSEKGLSMSIFPRTRKMVNYAWVGWSQGKPWWKLVAVLTCKSFVKLAYRGERLIEPSSSWFPPKFPSG